MVIKNQALFNVYDMREKGVNKYPKLSKYYWTVIPSKYVKNKGRGRFLKWGVWKKHPRNERLVLFKTFRRKNDAVKEAKHVSGLDNHTTRGVVLVCKSNGHKQKFIGMQTKRRGIVSAYKAGEETMKKRSEKARKMDKKRKADIADNILEWLRNPAGSDIKGVDTGQRRGEKTKRKYL